MKRRWFGVVLVALGAALVVAAVLAQTWAPGQVKRTPIDVNEKIHLAGSADTLDTKTGKLVSNPVYALSINQSDSNLSDGSVAVFVQTNCVVVDKGQSPQVCPTKSDPNLISVSVDTFATNRHTAETINDPAYLPKNFVPHTGLTNKFPFDAKKTTYQYWNSTLQRPIDAVYQRTADVRGLRTYVYRAAVRNAKTDVIPATSTTKPIRGTYTDVTDLYVDPRTGSIINQVESQQRYLTDGTKILDLQVAFTGAQQQWKINQANNKWDRITLVLDKLPIIGYAVGIPLLVIGLLLMFLRRRPPGEATAEPAESRTTVGV